MSGVLGIRIGVNDKQKTAFGMVLPAVQLLYHGEQRRDPQVIGSTSVQEMLVALPGADGVVSQRYVMECAGDGARGHDGARDREGVDARIQRSELFLAEHKAFPFR